MIGLLWGKSRHLNKLKVTLWESLEQDRGCLVFPGPMRINSLLFFAKLRSLTVLPFHKPAVPVPWRATPPHAISRALGIMMDGGDMLNYSGSVSSSSWWQWYCIFRLPRTAPDREICSLGMQKPIWPPTVRGIQMVPVVGRRQRRLKRPTPPKPHNSRLLWALGLDHRCSYVSTTWRGSDHNRYLSRGVAIGQALCPEVTIPSLSFQIRQPEAEDTMFLICSHTASNGRTQMPTLVYLMPQEGELENILGVHVEFFKLIIMVNKILMVKYN